MFTLVSEETYNNGEIIFDEGSSGDWIYLILSGSVEIYKMVNGKKVTIEVLKEGELFGELSFIGNIRRTASVRAIGKTSVGIIDRNHLYQEFNNLSSDFRSIIVAITRRFEKMLMRASGFYHRLSPRISKTLSVSFKNKNNFIKAYTGNISSGGLFIKTSKPMDPGVEFILKLQLPELSDSLKIKSEVVWKRDQDSGNDGRPAGMGIKFVEMSKRDNEILQKYVKSQLDNNNGTVI